MGFMGFNGEDDDDNDVLLSRLSNGNILKLSAKGFFEFNPSKPELGWFDTKATGRDIRKSSDLEDAEIADLISKGIL